MSQGEPLAPMPQSQHDEAVAAVLTGSVATGRNVPVLLTLTAIT